MTDWRQRAEALDQADPLAAFRERFAHDDAPRIYVDGNSLGRMPFATAARLDAVMEEWQRALAKPELDRLLREGEYAEAAARAIRVEQRSRHPMLFSFEKMALRDAVRSPEGAKLFAVGLRDSLHGKGTQQDRFNRFGRVLDSLPRRQTRVHTWPLHTVFGFIASPDREIFLKPNTMKRAAQAYGFDFHYASRPNWATYASLLEFASTIARDQADLGPRDLIDLQSFIWVLGSDEYA